MKNILYTILLLLITTTANSQSIYEPIEADIHEYLDRMNIKGIVQIDTEVKPFTRYYIAEKLFELSHNRSVLNRVEIEELNWYLSEYNYEVQKVYNTSSNHPTCPPKSFPRRRGIIQSSIPPHSTSPNLSRRLSTVVVSQTKEGSRFLTKTDLPSSHSQTPRWRVFSYTDSLFQLQISPVLGMGYKTVGKENGRFQFWGIRTFGTYGDNFGAYIHFTDNGEYNGIHQVNNFLSPDKGRKTIGAQVTSGIEFSDVRGSISYDWGWGNISLNKDYFSWGNGYYGNTILSAKAPSYTHLRFTLKPVDWFRFYYTHGWLTSNVIDSLRSQFNYGIYESDAEFFIPKYYAANLFVFEPVKSLELMIGNSAVYSGDNIRPEFLLPFMFFKYLDRDLGKGSVEDANGQLHFGVNYRPVNQLFLYGNILFDVIEINKTLEAENPNNWFGFTLGTKGINLIVDNLDFTLEYTRINPWVYEHKKSTTTYKHLDYSLGHWIGQNADLLRVQLDYKFIRPLKFSLYYQRFRKGGLKDITEAYSGSKNEQEEFLYGPLRKENSIGLDIRYNPFHEVYLNANYKYTDISDEDPMRTPDFQLGSNHNFSISLSYGFR